MIMAPDLAPLLRRFFSDRLIRQKDASGHTISSYRDTFRLLLKFLEKRLRKPPSRLLFEELRAPLIVAFLDELETARKISARSRNLRLTALRSFFRYAAFELPTHAAQIQRVLAIPGKRYPRTLVNFLSREEVIGLLHSDHESSILNLGEVDAALAFDLADEAHVCSVYNVHYTLKLASTYSGTLDTFKTPAKSSVALVFGWGCWKRSV